MVKMVTFLWIFYKIRKKIGAVTDFGIYVEMGISIIKTIKFYPGPDPKNEGYFYMKNTPLASEW